MLLALILAATAPACAEVRQPCRACTEVAGRPRCSTIGIACQPRMRICRKPARPTRPSLPAGPAGR